MKVVGKSRNVSVALAAAFLLSLCATRSARAQTGFDLLVKPWTDNTNYELDNLSASEQQRGREEDEDSRFQLYQAESDGRMRFGIPGVADDQKFLFLGYDVNDYTLASHGSLLPDRLFDGSVAIGAGLGEWDHNILAVSAGLGYAGDNPLAQRSAVYGKGDIILAHDFGQDRYLVLGIDYDDNRIIAPDLPLPGVAYQAQFSDTISYVVGFPYSYVKWNPWQPLTIKAQASFDGSIEGNIDYRLTPKLGLYGSYDDTAQGFHIDDSPYVRRLFFEQQRAEMGIDYAPWQNVSFTLAGGYAFDQRFYRGFDLDNLDIVTGVSDEPYVRVGASIRF
jgi:hypothetical protein